MVMRGEGKILPIEMERKSDLASAATSSLLYHNKRAPDVAPEYDRQLLSLRDGTRGPRCWCVLATSRSNFTQSLREWTGELQSDCMFVAATECVCSY